MQKTNFSIEELAIINIAVQTTPDKQARHFEPLLELPKAQAVMKKIMDCTEERLDQNGVTIIGQDWKPVKFFCEGEIYFSTEEKVFLLDLIKQNRFTVDQAESVATLHEKLK